MSRFVLAAITVLGLVFLASPLIVVVLGGLTPDTVLRLPTPGFSLRWVELALSDPGWMASIATSAYLAAMASFAATLFGTLAAIGISRSKSRYSAFLREVFLMPLMLPYIVLGAAILQVSALAGFLQTFFAILMGHIVIVIPFVLQSTLPLLTAEMPALEEASADLGASPLDTLWRITLPLIASGVLTGAVFAFIFSWTNVEMSMFQTTPEFETLPVKIYNYVQYQVDPLIAAVSGMTIVFSALIVTAIDVFFGLALVPKAPRSGKTS